MYIMPGPMGWTSKSGKVKKEVLGAGQEKQEGGRRRSLELDIKSREFKASPTGLDSASRNLNSGSYQHRHHVYASLQASRRHATAYRHAHLSGMHQQGDAHF